MSYLTKFSLRRTPQRRADSRHRQVPNSAGGFAWAVDDWTRLRRFLILGSEGGSYYAGERTLTRENATAVWRCIAADGAACGARDRGDLAATAARRRTTRRSSRSRWRPRRPRTRRASSPSTRCRDVCRTGTHLFAFARYVEQFRGWGRGAAPRRRRVVRRPAGGPARLPGGQVPPARRHDPPRPPAPRAPGREDPRGQPAPATSPTSTRGCSSGSSAAGATDGLPRLIEGFVQRAGRAATRDRDGAADRRVRPAARGGQAGAPRQRRGVGGAARARCR